MTKELTVIENLDLVPFFTKGDALDETLAKIAEEARAHVPDVSTGKGRDAIKANVTLVTKSKTYLEANGKELAAEYKAIPKRIDENRKKAKDFLTALQAEVRKPLTDWEEAEKARKAAEKLAEEIKQAELEAIIENMEFDKQKLAEAEEAKRQAAEQERLRLEREEEIKAQAKLEAEQAAEAEKQRLEQAKIDAEAARIKAEEYAVYQAEQAKKAEAQAKLDAEQREIDRIAYEKHQEELRIAAEEKAKIDAANAAEQARLNQIAQQEAEAAAKQAQLDKLAADKKHSAMIHNQIKDLVMSTGVDEATAIEVVKAMVKSPLVTVNY